MPKVHPASDTGPGRLGRGRRVSTSLSEMNVVPLVDVMLVLLIIFMVASPMIQRGIDVRLPVATRASQISGERVYVTLRRDFPQKQTVWLGTEEIRVSALGERVRQRMEASADKKVYLQGERGVMYDDVIRIIDLLKAAGVSRRRPGHRRPGAPLNGPWKSPTSCATACTNRPAFNRWPSCRCCCTGRSPRFSCWRRADGSSQQVETPREVMTISLAAGTPGPTSGGMTSDQRHGRCRSPRRLKR